MRVRVATTILGITTALLALPACSTDTVGTEPAPMSSARTGKPTSGTPVLSSAALESRLLDENDLGSGYLRKPERPAQHDDVTVIGCIRSSRATHRSTCPHRSWPRHAVSGTSSGASS